MTGESHRVLEVIRAGFDRVQYREHAIEKLAERGILPSHIRDAVFSIEAEVIDSRPDHPYGPCHLVLGWRADHRPLHMLFGTTEPLRVITAWDPSVDPKNRWEADFKTRRRQLDGDHHDSVPSVP